ncbi:MAG TPA: 16S rRNA (adenine(1518)-N(6)/adenine(1519)-N(6))-dimethyltransferase RsmA [Gemmatimonadaceae bacterium]|jgi:16S rRNA (adenine1518-N6/adenine1519-N6)-dimethyltransferase|nr:16S rRNA (adenine(1518)-N(6)/adenine(1519)-N(6))-dimethyltransferase RsmA [Gemmatimonadaceae bacterium]
MPRRRDGLPPVRKSLGQHFLADSRALSRIVDALQLTGQETVLEIGPGRGALTDLLVPRAARLVLIEYDRALAALLRDRYAAMPSVEVVEADVLQVNLAALAGGPYVLVGNVPYYITTPILFHALVEPRPARAVYLVQREVAERLAASPGTSEYGALSVNVQAVARVEMIAKVPAGAFRPPPKVDSAIVRVTPRPDPVVTPAEEARYRSLVQGAFGMRRKQMRRVTRTLASLDAERAEDVLRRAGIGAEVRPETLSPAEFASLLRALRG